MLNLLPRDWSPVRALAALNGGLVLVYLALIAFVMSYAALEVQFADSMRQAEGAVGTLESRYLDSVSRITTLDYVAAGYKAPTSLSYVPEAPEAAINLK